MNRRTQRVLYASSTPPILRRFSSAYPYTTLKEPSSPKLMSPLPSYIQIAGRLFRVSPFSAATLAICHQCKSSYILSKPNTWVASCRFTPKRMKGVPLLLQSQGGFWHCRLYKAWVLPGGTQSIHWYPSFPYSFFACVLLNFLLFFMQTVCYIHWIRETWLPELSC